MVKTALNTYSAQGQSIGIAIRGGFWITTKSLDNQSRQCNHIKTANEDSDDRMRKKEESGKRPTTQSV